MLIWRKLIIIILYIISVQICTYVHISYYQVFFVHTFHTSEVDPLDSTVSSYIAEYYDRMLWYMPHVYFMLNPPSVDWCVLVASCCSSKLPRTGILPNSLHCIGQTPMVRLDKIAKKEGLQCELREFTIIGIACVSSLYMCTSLSSLYMYSMCVLTVHVQVYPHCTCTSLSSLYMCTSLSSLYMCTSLSSLYVHVYQCVHAVRTYMCTSVSLDMFTV